MQIQFFLAFCLYIIIIFFIGLVSSYINRKKQIITNNDFILGGRSTHWLLTALSAHAADMSDWLFMGLPGSIYLLGGQEIWIPIGLLCGMFCSWHFVAPKIRTATEKYQAVTLASYFKHRFQDNSGLIIGIAGLIAFFFFSTYVAVGLKGIGYVLKSVFEIDYHLGILIAIIVVSMYLLTGGFLAVAWLDLFQGMFLLLMLLLVPICAFFKIDGITQIINIAQQKHINISLFPEFSISYLLSIMLNPFAWGLGYFGMPHIISKFMGTKNAKDLYKAKYFGCTWQLLATSAAVAVGIIGIAYFPFGVPGRNEFIFIEMAKRLFDPFFAGIVLCAILAATISTVDSQILVLASIATEDFYKHLINPQASSRQLQKVYNGALILGCFSGLLFAWNEQSTIMALVRYAWAGLGASYGPLVLASLYSNYPNKYGALAGIICGATVSILWSNFNPIFFGIEIYAIVPAFLSSFIAIFLVSWIFKR
jgi:SSS family solute:Na+ symporter